MIWLAVIVGIIYLIAGIIYQGVVSALNSTSFKIPWFMFLLWPLYFFGILTWWEDI